MNFLAAKVELDDQLTCRKTAATGDMAAVTADDGTHHSVAPIHPVHRLPDTFRGLPNGHNGSHQFLVDDFIRACLSDKLPPNNAWEAARYMMPGLIAHESALNEGKLLEIPDLGDPPDNNRLEIDQPVV